ncbi:MAG: Gfo/Idh/MocA family oxidoreductase [Bacteroidales bacterium]
MIHKESKCLQVGVLGCGPIAQFAHFESCRKARNAELYAICDRADDLRERMEAVWQPQKAYSGYDEMLADPRLEAVIIATADAFHVPLALKAVQAGKHVLIEKPLSHSLDECRELTGAARSTGLVVRVAHNKRFDPGIQFARDFVNRRMGDMLALKAWYADSTHRYTVTDNVQPLPYKSTGAIKPGFDEKADKERYYMMAHGSHLLDTAMFLGGRIGSLKARLKEGFGACCWMIEVDFESGALGQLDLTVAVRMDWHEGFQIYGEKGSVLAKTYNPWYHKSSDVECFSEEDGQYHRPLGADGFTYRRQVEGFADEILHGAPGTGTGLDEGTHIVRGMLAIRESVRSGKTVHLDQLKLEEF